jgi:hypothetical protein
MTWKVVSLDGYRLWKQGTQTLYLSKTGRIIGMKFLRWVIIEKRPLIAIILCLNVNTDAFVVNA